jgi:hypothetical protein
VSLADHHRKRLLNHFARFQSPKPSSDARLDEISRIANARLGQDYRRAAPAASYLRRLAAASLNDGGTGVRACIAYDVKHGAAHWLCPGEQR